MTHALLDTNVVLDALLDRQPWSADAKALWQAHLNNQLAAHITATSLTDVFYISRRHAGRDRAWLAVQACLDQLYIISVGFNELHVATTMGGSDFEDSLQIACARSLNSSEGLPIRSSSMSVGRRFWGSRGDLNSWPSAVCPIKNWMQPLTLYLSGDLPYGKK